MLARSRRSRQGPLSYSGRGPRSEGCGSAPRLAAVLGLTARGQTAPPYASLFSSPRVWEHVGDSPQPVACGLSNVSNTEASAARLRQKRGDGTTVLGGARTRGSRGTKLGHESQNRYCATRTKWLNRAKKAGVPFPTGWVRGLVRRACAFIVRTRGRVVSFHHDSTRD